MFLLTWGLLKHYEFDLLPKSELASIDDRIRYGRKTPVHPDIVFLAIDAPSTSLTQLDDSVISASKPLSIMKAGYPFARDLYPEICDRLIQAGARAVAFDIFFLPPKPEDPPWRAAIDRYREQVVIGMNFSDDKREGSSTLTLPTTDLFPEQDPMDNRLAYLNFWKDVFGTVREAQYRQNLEYIKNKTPGSEKLPKFYSLAARTVQKAGFTNVVPDDLAGRTMRFAGAPESAFPTYSLYKIFDPHQWTETFKNGDYFRDKIVLVGPQGDWTKDELETPWGRMNGAEIHLNAINDLLEGGFLYPASKGLELSTVIGAAMIALLLALTIIPVAWRFLAALGVFAGYLFALIWAYNGPGWLLPAVAPMSVFGGATGVGFIYDFVLTQIEKQRLRATFERYNPPNVVKYLLEHTDAYNEMLAGARRPITALFSDVRDFTSMAEGSDSHALVKKLNEYLTAMVACVFRFDGTLDSFMGDGIMAVWGSLPFNHDPKENAVGAVRAALAMIVELRKLNAQWRAKGETEWRFGIGLNHGEVIVGDIGSQQHKEFATIGDAVNLASRIEGLTKFYQVEILIGESVAGLVRDRFHLKTADLVRAKGKEKAVEVFTVLGEKTTPLSADEQKFLGLYEEGIVKLRARQFEAAKGLFEQALQIQPDDFLAQYHAQACGEYIETPPDAAWTGVRVMTKK